MLFKECGKHSLNSTELKCHTNFKTEAIMYIVHTHNNRISTHAVLDKFQDLSFRLRIQPYEQLDRYLYISYV